MARVFVWHLADYGFRAGKPATDLMSGSFQDRDGRLVADVVSGSEGVFPAMLGVPCDQDREGSKDFPTDSWLRFLDGLQNILFIAGEASLIRLS